MYVKCQRLRRTIIDNITGLSNRSDLKTFARRLASYPCVPKHTTPETISYAIVNYTFISINVLNFRHSEFCLKLSISLSIFVFEVLEFEKI